MKSKFYFRLIILTLIFSCYEKTIAQSPDWLWAKSMGGMGSDGGISIAVDLAGNVYTTGYYIGTVDFDPGAGTFNLTTNGNSDIFISKLDQAGNFVWAKAFNGLIGNDFGRSIAVDSVGNVYITGYFTGTVDFDPNVDTFNLTSNGSFDIFISKLDRDGNFLWAKSIGGTSSDFSRSIAIDHSGSGDIYITGSFNEIVDFDPGPGTFNLNAPGSYDVFITKLDHDGNFLWAKAFEGLGNDYGQCILIDPSGNGSIYTAGRFQETVDFDPGAGVFNLTSEGNFDIFISKLDRDGNFLWAKSMGGTGNDIAWSIALDPTSSGDIYTAGSFEKTVDFNPGLDIFNLTSNGYADIFISKLDSAGNFLWAKSIGGTNDDEANSIALDPVGKGVYATGYFEGLVDFDPGPGTLNLYSKGTSSDIFIAKFDLDGNLLWVQINGGPKRDYGQSIVVDALEHVHVIGAFYSPSISFNSSILTNQDQINVSTDIFIAKLDVVMPSGVADYKTYQINMYPNPVTDKLTIVLNEDKLHDLNITLFNILGESVFTSTDKNIAHQKIIDISALANGIYFIELDIDGNRVTDKVVKE